MKKNLLIIAAALTFVACNNANTKSTQTTDSNVTATENVDTAQAPVMTFTTSVYDFGKIQQGQKVSYDFEFVNEGKSPLIISNASATCGCTVPDYPKEPIAPGAKGNISVIFDSSGKEGLQDKVVTITANTLPANTELRVVGEIIK